MGLEREELSGLTAELEAWRVRVLNALLTVVGVIGAPIVGWTVYMAIRNPEQRTAAAIFAGSYLLLLVLAISRRMNSRVRAWGLLLLGYAIGIVAFARGGLAGDGRIFMLALPVLALILAGVRSGIIMAVLSLLAFAVFTFLAQQGQMARWLVHLDNPLTLEPWLYGGAVFTMLLVLLLLLMHRFYRFQIQTLQSARRSAAELAEVQNLLRERAKRLEEANRLLQERTRALETAAEVARQIAALRGEQELIDQFLNLMAERFALYHVGLFRLDPRRERLILRAASSAGGQRLVDQRYRIPIDSEDPAARVIREGKPLFLSVPEPIPELRWTRWRLSLPLRARGELFGVLDIHIADEQPIPDEQIQTFQTLADQFAVGLDNARLLEQMQRSLEELSQVYQVMTVRAWEQFIEGGPGIQRYWVEESSIPEAVWRSLFEQARQRGEPVSRRVETEGEVKYALAVPVKLRGVPIGVIGFHRPAEAGEWGEQETALAEAVAERMALAMENVRLLEETQRRAARERMVGEMTARLVGHPSVDGVLQTAARELGQLPRVVEAVVQLVPPTESETA